MSNPVLVIPHRRVRGLDTDPRTLPADETPAAYPLVPLVEALTREWETDAHAVQYLVPGSDQMPRLNGGAIGWLRAQGVEPVMVRAVVDCDTPGHTAWTDFPGGAEWWAETLKVLRESPELAGAWWYHTRAGYHLWWELPQPIPVSRWRTWSQQLVEHLRARGILADPLHDWTRLTRLPRVVRDGVAQDRPRAEGLPGPLRWSPAVRVAVPDRVSSAPLPPVGATAPEYTPPTDDEWGMLRRRRVPDDVVDVLVEGHPLAPPPENRKPGKPGRDTLFLQYAGTVIGAFGSLDPTLLYRYFYASIQAQHPAAEINLETLWDRCTYLVRKHAAEGRAGALPRSAAVIPLRRPDDDCDGGDLQMTPGRAQPPEYSRERGDLHTASGGDAEARPHRGQRPDSAQYSGGAQSADNDCDDLDAIAQDTSHLAAQAAVARRLLLTEPKTREYWVYDAYTSELTAADIYQGPVASGAVVMEMERYCPALAGKLRSGETGQGNPYSTPRILADSGTLIRQDRIELRAGQQHTVYDPQAHRLTCGIAPWQTGIVPREHPQIHEWLTLIGGDHPDKLLDWLATFRQVEKPTCALYLKGPPGTGKGLFYAGLARLFAAGEFVPYSALVTDFPEELFRSLLVVADEALPRVRTGLPTSAQLRTMIASDQHRVNKKGLTPQVVHGALRFIIAGNNDHIIDLTDEDPSYEDLAATVIRFGYLRSDDAPAKYLERIGGRRATESWVAGRGIAEHVLWLEQNREVERGARLLVHGWKSPMHDRLLQKAGIVQLVLTALAHVLEEYDKHRTKGAVVIKDGGLYVNANELRKIWTQVMPDSGRTPTLHRLTSALGNSLSRPWNVDNERTRVMRYGVLTSRSYWHLDKAAVLECARGFQIGDPAAMAALFENKG